MHMTHEEALQLIQYNADRAVHGIQEKMLNEHLKECAQCRAYAQQFTEMENIVQHVMRKHWNQRPTPLTMDALMATKHGIKNMGALLITRTALISIAFVAFFFIGWQFTFTNKAAQGIQPGMFPIPTPSTQYTATLYQSANCQEVLYKVKENDTLESIADQHATTKEIIMTLNKLNSETVRSSMELLIPICDSTPTSTINAPTLTLTPFIETITNTPG